MTENVNNTTVFHQSSSIGECYYWLFFFGLKCNFPQIANFNIKTFLEVEGKKKTVFVIFKPLPLHLFPYERLIPLSDQWLLPFMSLVRDLELVSRLGVL